MKVDDLFAHEKPGERAESRRFAQASFLELIPRMRPECVYDLWRMAFFEFAYATAERFQQKLLNETEQSPKSGEQVFLQMFIEAVRKAHDLNPDNCSIGDAFLFAFAKFGSIEAKELKQEFPDWKRLANVKRASHLCDNLKSWSKKWNLDADWCRDHAVETLRVCLLDEYLKWSFLSEITPLHLALQPFLNSSALDVSQTLNTSLHDNRVIHKSWKWAIHELTMDIYWSRLNLSAEVHGGKFDPENFEFKWRKIEFTRYGYNRLRYTQRQYKKLVTLEFRLYLNEIERSELTRLLGEENSSEKGNSRASDMYAASYGVLEKFRKKLDKHVKATIKKTKKNSRGLVRIKRRPKLDLHLRWTIEYQLPQAKALAEIAESHAADPSTVLRGINEALRLMALAKRPDAKPGRTIGQKNKYNKTLAQLGR